MKKARWQRYLRGVVKPERIARWRDMGLFVSVINDKNVRLTLVGNYLAVYDVKGNLKYLE